MKLRRDRWASRATSPAILETIREGDSDAQILERAGKPISDDTWNRRRNRRRADKDDDEPERRHMMYFDGRRRWDLNFEAGILHNKHVRSIINFEEDRSVFAAVFQHFYLRLAIFFGCLG